MKKTYILENLDCAECAGKIETEVGKLDGVSGCTVALMTQKMTLETDREDISGLTKEIKKIVKKYEPEVTVVEK